MHNGFYLDLKELQKEYPESDFGFLENEYAGTTISAAEFLHGYCNSFACELSKRYGYKIEEIKNFENKLVHAYCIGRLNRKTAYIDIRGITTDAEEFFAEFCDDVNVFNGNIDESQFEEGWLFVSRYLNTESYLSQHSCLDPGSLLNLSDTANAFIDENFNFYDLNSLQKPSLSSKIEAVSSRVTEVKSISKGKEPEL